MQRKYECCCTKECCKKKSTILGLGIFFGLAAVVAITAGCEWFIMNDLYIEKSELYDREFWDEKSVYREEDHVSIKMKRDDFKILQLTDTHIHCFGTLKNLIDELIQMSDPDLVVFTGDICRDKLSCNNIFSYVKRPWTSVMGNHDHESINFASWIGRNAYYRNGPYTVSGYGNFDINVKSAEGENVYKLLFLDSGSSILEDGKTGGYDVLHIDQLKYLNFLANEPKAKSGDLLPSLLFMHIPPPEFGSEKCLSTMNGEMHERVSCGLHNVGVVDMMLERNCMGIFVGHDHVNNYSCTYSNDNGKSITLAYGLKTGPYFYTRKGMNGGRLIIIYKDGSMDTNLLFVD